MTVELHNKTASVQNLLNRNFKIFWAQPPCTSLTSGVCSFRAQYKGLPISRKKIPISGLLHNGCQASLLRKFLLCFSLLQSFKEDDWCATGLLGRFLNPKSTLYLSESCALENIGLFKYPTSRESVQLRHTAIIVPFGILMTDRFIVICAFVGKEESKGQILWDGEGLTLPY